MRLSQASFAKWWCTEFDFVEENYPNKRRNLFKGGPYNILHYLREWTLPSLYIREENFKPKISMRIHLEFLLCNHWVAVLLRMHSYIEKRYSIILIDKIWTSQPASLDGWKCKLHNLGPINVVTKIWVSLVEYHFWLL